MEKGEQSGRPSAWSAALDATLQAGQPTTPVMEPSVERLLRALEAHSAAETVSFETYRLLADSSPDPVVALLVRVVLQDEDHHQHLLGEMTLALRRSLDPTQDDGLSPRNVTPARTYPAEAINAARSLIRDEREAARYLRHLARQEPRLYSGVYPLLLESMARDCEKHGHVLRFILRRLELLWPATPSPSGGEGTP